MEATVYIGWRQGCSTDNKMLLDRTNVQTFHIQALGAIICIGENNSDDNQVIVT